jgi:hypothetical protein
MKIRGWYLKEIFCERKRRHTRGNPVPPDTTLFRGLPTPYPYPGPVK